MAFASSTFIMAFLPAFLAAYFVLPMRGWRNAVLLVFSLLFYAWGDPAHLALLAAAIVLNWALGLAVGAARERRPRLATALAALGIVADVGALALFKYAGPLGLPAALPLGASYVSLRCVAYLADVRRGRVRAQANPLLFALFVAMFQSMVAGPVTRYQTVGCELSGRRETLSGVAGGLRMFATGLAQKVLLSDAVGTLAAEMLSRGGAGIGLLGSWAGLLAYSFQLYFDFAGYSLMAVGLARVCGFTLERNFNYPYASRSVTEFWRRWHISLSTFFREYVYIPLGGSRAGTGRTVLNLAVVWVLTGVWHGATWNFVAWGLFFLAALLVEKFALARALEAAPAALRHLYVAVVVMLAWLLFWVSDPACLLDYLAAMAGLHGLTGSATPYSLIVWQYLPLLLACCVASAPVVPWLRTRVVGMPRGRHFRHASGRHFHPAPPALLGEGGELGFREVDSSTLCDVDGYAREAATPARRALVNALSVLCDLALIALAALSVAALASGSFSSFVYAAF